MHLLNELNLKAGDTVKAPSGDILTVIAVHVDKKTKKVLFYEMKHNNFVFRVKENFDVFFEKT